MRGQSSNGYGKHQSEYDPANVKIRAHFHFVSVQLKRYTFMHNGGITGFPQMKRHLLSQLGDEAYEAMEGTTDSEV